ncbi:MAG: hypothetical protein QQN41_08635, partial [Nitrosopumilus sp.]
GIVYPSPDYQKYAKNYGLSDFEISISNEDTAGAIIKVDGKPIEVDMVKRMSSLTKKLLAEGLSFDEFVEYFANILKLPQGEIIIRPTSNFYVNGVVLSYANPLTVYEATQRYLSKAYSDSDISLLKKVNTLFNEVKINKLSIEMR